MEGQLEDYALYCWALLELYGANFSVSCLREAAGLGDRMAALFEDREAGGFYPSRHRYSRIPSAGMG